MKALLNEQAEWERDKLHAAIHGSQCAKYSLQFMKIRAKADPPRATTERMPFSGHRTVAQWTDAEKAGVRT